MTHNDLQQILRHLVNVFKPHPWHGIDATPEKAEGLFNAYIEIVPTDTVKYEMDKKTGYLMVDRPQKFSNIVPSLYGFVPKTLCGERVAQHTMKSVHRDDLVGDGDPIDICVLTEKSITHGDLIVQARPIGGFRMIDNGEVDDKIIAVLKDDPIYSQWRDINDCPQKVVDRLRHYFLTYKEIPGNGGASKVEITHTYGCEEALQVIAHSQSDYANTFDGIEFAALPQQ